MNVFSRLDDRPQMLGERDCSKDVIVDNSLDWQSKLGRKLQQYWETAKTNRQSCEHVVGCRQNHVCRKDNVAKFVNMTVVV